MCRVISRVLGQFFCAFLAPAFIIGVAASSHESGHESGSGKSAKVSESKSSKDSKANKAKVKAPEVVKSPEVLDPEKLSTWLNSSIWSLLALNFIAFLLFLSTFLLPHILKAVKAIRAYSLELSERREKIRVEAKAIAEQKKAELAASMAASIQNATTNVTVKETGKETTSEVAPAAATGLENLPPPPPVEEEKTEVSSSTEQAAATAPKVETPTAPEAPPVPAAAAAEVPAAAETIAAPAAEVSSPEADAIAAQIAKAMPDLNSPTPETKSPAVAEVPVVEAAPVEPPPVKDQLADHLEKMAKLAEAAVPPQPAPEIIAEPVSSMTEPIQMPTSEDVKEVSRAPFEEVTEVISQEVTATPEVAAAQAIPEAVAVQAPSEVAPVQEVVAENSSADVNATTEVIPKEEEFVPPDPSALAEAIVSAPPPVDEKPASETPAPKLEPMGAASSFDKVLQEILTAPSDQTEEIPIFDTSSIDQAIKEGDPRL